MVPPLPTLSEEDRPPEWLRKWKAVLHHSRRFVELSSQPLQSGLRKDFSERAIGRSWHR